MPDVLSTLTPANYWCQSAVIQEPLQGCNGLVCVCVCVFMCVRVRACAKLLPLCPTPYNSMHCSSPGCSVHGILQARILEWVAIPFSRGSSHPRDRTCISCIAGRFFTV